ncbi:MAG: PhoX family phosphatase [Granulosicoccus sp.]|nr:PhoX family phosphatase [Granulosicoccus sp.]
MSHDEQISNPSDNLRFEEIAGRYLSRRQALKGGLGAAAVTMTGFSDVALAKSSGSYGHKYRKRRHNRLIGFEPVPVSQAIGAEPAISSDYEYQVLIPWGEPLEPGGPEFSYPPSAADQARQIGIGHDGMWFFPLRNRRGQPSNRHGMLAINHEFGRNSHVLGKSAPESLEDVRLSQHAHGVSIVEIKKLAGKWRQRRSQKARRIHVNTPVDFSGPVAGHPLLATPNGNIPLGTVNNCANGYTPWGTYLTCEENFNGYFGATNADEVWLPTEEQERYGFTENGFFYGWHNFDRRFDLSDSDYQNEENRFGWVVEIDPMDATQKPVKRTALGRFKHEGVAITVGRGNRVVAYMGDDQRFDYIYKFVSADNWKKMRREGRDPLDEGKLYAARFNEDGTGDWLELTIEDPVLSGRFADQAEVLTYARVAADLLGATPMDRPEWTTVAPDQTVYCTLTNNSRRDTADAANPMAPNLDGHIIRWKDSKKHIGETFEWDIFMLAKDSHGTEDTYSDPDGLWADPDGRLFIQTDGGQTDGGDTVVLNNQLLVADTRTGELRRLFAGVTDDEITGITLTPDRRTLFINTQHPGNGDPAKTNFPASTDGVTVPRDCTIVITRKDGGIIGS